LSVTRAFEASGPERATTFLPARTAIEVAATARPFTMVSVDAGRGTSRGRAEPALPGFCAGAGWTIVPLELELASPERQSWAVPGLERPRLD
jgi:hypothetical protein